MEKFTVYKLSCSKTSKCYIGQTCEPLAIRLSKHFSDYKTRYDGRPLHLAFDQFGIDCWTIEALETGCTFDDSVAFEIDNIAKFDSFYKGFNGSTGGFGTAGTIWNEERKRKLSESLKKTYATKTIEELRVKDETRNLMSKSKLEKHWRSETCIVNGTSFKSLRQAAIAFSTTIYKVKLAIESGTELKHGKVDWDYINETELRLKEEKYLKRKSVA